MYGSYRRLSDDQWKQQAEEALNRKKESESRKGGGDFRWLRCADGEAIFFYILPPFSDRGAISRELFKYFNLPDDRAKHALAWKSFEIFEPGIGEKDPILQALRAVDKHAGGKTDRMWPSRKIYLNVIYAGKKKVDELGNDAGQFEPAPEVAQHILEMSSRAFDDLMARIYAPGMKPIFYPEHAVLVQLMRRTEKDQVTYSVDLIGTKTPTGFSPSYENLFEKYGDALNDILSHLVDLDKVWKLPSEEDKATAHRVANTLRIRFGAPTSLAGGPLPQTAGPPSSPPSTPAVNAPWSPPSNPSPQGGITSAPQEVAPSTAAPTTAPPAASAPAVPDFDTYLATDPPSSPPKTPGKAQPICFQKFHTIQASPKGHGKLCSGCPFKILCELQSKKV